MKNASIIRQLFALLIDIILIYVISVLMLHLVQNNITYYSAKILAGLIAIVYFFAVFLLWDGKGLGNSILGIKIISETAPPKKIKQIIIRTGVILTIISPIGIIYLLTLFNILLCFYLQFSEKYKDENILAWDFYGKTRVVYERVEPTS